MNVLNESNILLILYLLELSSKEIPSSVKLFLQNFA